jgi:hypothetical protein
LPSRWPRTNFRVVIDPGQFVLSSLVLVLLFRLPEKGCFPAGPDWLWLIGLALISQVLGQTAIAHALGRVPPAQAAIGLLVQPVSAAIFAWMLFGETLSSRQLLGAIGLGLNNCGAPLRAIEGLRVVDGLTKLIARPARCHTARGISMSAQRSNRVSEESETADDLSTSAAGREA